MFRRSSSPSTLCLCAWLALAVVPAASCTGLKDDDAAADDGGKGNGRDGGPRDTDTDSGPRRPTRDSGANGGDRDSGSGSSGSGGEDPGSSPGADGGGTPDDAGSSPGMDAQAPVDSGNEQPDTGVDSGGGDPEPVCTAADDTCSGDMLKICKSDGTGFDMTPCAVGCATTPTPHCTRLYPSGPVTADDLAASGLSAITISGGDALLNTDTGAISGVVTRAGNTVNTRREVISGIAFHQTTDGYGVFSFASLTVAGGGTVKLIGSRAAALVSAANLVVHGTIEARPMDASGALCPAELVAGPGGARGGIKSMLVCCPMPISGENGGGPGGGGGAARNAIMGSPGGGGGAGHAAAGGKAGGSCSQNQPVDNGGVAGVSYTTGLLGGSGGGGGGVGDGGGGGGAVRLVAAVVITIGDGTAVAGVNAGACGGKGGGGGGGGGSGGTIVLEAPFVQLSAKGTLAANGGGGGASSSGAAVDGQPGQLNATGALAGGSFPGSAPGGNGGAGNTLAGTASLTQSCSGTIAVGGGGAAGRVEIRSSAGSANVNAQAVISPSISSGAARMTAADVH